MNQNDTPTPEETAAEVSAAVADVMDHFGLNTLSPKEQQVATQKISDLLMKEIFARLIDRISDQEAQRLSDYLDSQPEELELYRLLLAEHETVFLEVIQEVNQEFLTDADYVLQRVGE